MKTTRKIIHIDEELCDGCGQCVPSCEEGAIQIIDGKARLVADKYCDGLGNCLGECPQGAITMIEREADPFDEAAVEELLAAQGRADSPPAFGGCPSQRLQSFSPCQQANQPTQQSGSSLSHWPVQIRLVPPHAPFLDHADLLVTADCAPVACADYHSLLQGKVALLGCPKFDSAEEYLEKFTAIFTTARIKSVTVLSMEVPCCSGLAKIVAKARRQSGADVPVENVIISTRGTILSRQPVPAQELTLA